MGRGKRSSIFWRLVIVSIFLQLLRHRLILSLLAPDERRARALIKNNEQPLLDDDDKSTTMIVDDDPSSSMMIDVPSALSFHTPASTASTKNAPSGQSAPPANPSAFTASTKGNGKRKRTRDSNRTSKKQKKQQRKKKGKDRTNTEESDAEESNEEEEEGEEEFNETPSDVDASEDDSDGDEDIPLRLTTRTTARQLAKDVSTDSSALVGCDQSFTQGPRLLELPVIPPSVSEIADPSTQSVQSRNTPLPDKGGDKSPHSVVRTSSDVLELSQPGGVAVVNIAADRSAVDSSPIDSFDQPLAKLLSPPPNDVAEPLGLPSNPPSPIPTPSTPTQPPHANPAPESLPNPAWPTWFANAYETLKSKNIGPIFSALLPLYIELESRTNFDVGGHMTGFRKGDRPEEVSWWINRGREREPTIKNVDAFDKRWWSWWKALQPPSRQVAAVEGLLGGEHRLVEAQEDWDVLRKHGQNGFLTILSTLAWWGGSINGKPLENFASWLAAVDEVHWVLLRLLELRYAITHCFLVQIHRLILLLSTPVPSAVVTRKRKR